MQAQTLSLSVSWRSLFPGAGENPQSEGSVFTRLCISHDSSASDLLMEMLGLVISGARNISE